MENNQNEDKYLKKPETEELEMAKGYLDCATQDITASEILHQYESYSLSTYHLQQAVEKTSKAVGILFFKRTKKEVLIASHDIPKIYMPFAKENFMVELQKALLEKYPEYPILKIDDVEWLAKNENKKEIAETPYEIFEIFFQKFDEQKQKIEEVYNKEVDEIVQKYSPIRHILRQNQDKSTEIIRKIKKAPEKYPYFELIEKVSFLTAASFLVWPHEAFTRYPDGPLTNKNYTNQLGVVKATPRFLKEIKETIKKIEEYMVELPEIEKKLNK